MKQNYIPIKTHTASLKKIKFSRSSTEKEIGANTGKPVNKETDLLNGEMRRAAYRMLSKIRP